MISIQKFYSIHIGLFGLLPSYLVHRILFGPLWFPSIHSIHIGPILFTSVQFNWHWSYSIHFCPIWSTLVLFSPFCLLRSYSVHSIHLGFILSTLGSYSVHSAHFGSNQSILTLLVLSSLLQSTLVHFVLFGPL